MTSDQKTFNGWPLAVAWRAGRRIYVPTAYGSPLAAAMRALGTWDPAQRAWWASTAKADQVQALLTEHVGTPTGATAAVEAKAARANEVAAIIRQGHAISLWRNETTAREAVKAAGGVWDPATTKWYLPSAEALAAAVSDVEQIRRATSGERAAARREAAVQAAATSAAQARSSTTRTILAPETERRLTFRFPPSRRAQAETRLQVGAVAINEERVWLVLSINYQPEVDIDDNMIGWVAVADTVEVEATDPEREQILHSRRAKTVHEVAATLRSLRPVDLTRASRETVTGEAVMTQTRNGGLSMEWAIYAVDEGYVLTRSEYDGSVDANVRVALRVPADAAEQIREIIAWGSSHYAPPAGAPTRFDDVRVAVQ